MIRHLNPRQPGKKNGFSWSRSSRDGVVCWYMFRRDQRGKIHHFKLCESKATQRDWIAKNLRRARHALRDQVDTVDLALMGVTS